MTDGWAGVCCLERQVPAFFKLLDDPVLQEERFRDPIQRAEQDEGLRQAHALSSDQIFALQADRDRRFEEAMTTQTETLRLAIKGELLFHFKMFSARDGNVAAHEHHLWSFIIQER